MKTILGIAILLGLALAPLACGRNQAPLTAVAGVGTYTATPTNTPAFTSTPTSTPNTTPTATATAVYPFQSQWTNLGKQGLSNPTGICVDASGNVFVMDQSANFAVFKVDSSGDLLLDFGFSGGPTAGNGAFHVPAGAGVDSSENIYVADSGDNLIQKFNSTGTFITQWGTPTLPGNTATPTATPGGNGNGIFNNPQGVAVNALGYVFVADSNNNRVQVFTGAGVYQYQWGSFGSGNGQFIQPSGIAVDPSGYVYVVDSGNKRIQKFTDLGVYVTQWNSYAGTTFNNPHGIATDDSSNVYVVDETNVKIVKFTSNGTYLTQWGTTGSGMGQLESPFFVAVNAEGYVYVTDNYGRVSIYAPH